MNQKIALLLLVGLMGCDMETPVHFEGTIQPATQFGVTTLTGATVNFEAMAAIPTQATFDPKTQDVTVHMQNETLIFKNAKLKNEYEFQVSPFYSTLKTLNGTDLGLRVVRNAECIDACNSLNRCRFERYKVTGSIFSNSADELATIQGHSPATAEETALPGFCQH